MLTLVIVTLGLFILINSAAGWIWGFDNRGFPSLFGDGTSTSAASASRSSRSASSRVLLGVVGVLFLFFQRTKVGLAMRAVSMNPDSSRLVGHLGRAHADDRLGDRGAGRRAGRRADRAAPVPGRQLHGRRADLLVRRRHARRLRQPARRRGRRLDHRRHREPGRHLRRLHRLRPEDPRAAGDRSSSCCWSGRPACSARRRWRGREARKRLRIAALGAGGRARVLRPVLLRLLPRRPVHAGAGATRSRCSG